MAFHLAVCAPLIFWEEADHWRYMRDSALNAVQPAQRVAFQDEQIVSFQPMCQGIRGWRTKVLMSSELPAWIAAGWGWDCPAPWTAAGMLGIDMKHHGRAREVESSVAFFALIGAQWLLLGSIPIPRWRIWYLNPDGTISISLAFAALMSSLASIMAARPLGAIEAAAIIPGSLAFLAMILALLAWLWWLALLLWNILQAGWGLLLRKPAVRPTISS